MNSSPRERLIDAGLRLLERDGPEALQARKVSAEIGASTMAVYTHFGGMAALVEAITALSFERFAAALSAAPATGDPMADFFVMGAAYRAFALESPQRYRLMFGPIAPQLEQAPTVAMPVAMQTFGLLVAAVERIIASTRIRADDPVELAWRIWAMIHGVVQLELRGAFAEPGSALNRILGPMTVDMFVGMGDARADAERSLQRATAAIAAPGRGQRG